MKVLLVVYLVFSLGTFVFQMVVSDFFLVCQFNTGACMTLMLEQTWNSVVWPHWLLLA